MWRRRQMEENSVVFIIYEKPTGWDSDVQVLLFRACEPSSDARQNGIKVETKT